MFNLITLLMQNTCRMVCEPLWVAGDQMPDQLKIPANHVVFHGWSQCRETIAINELPECPP